MNVKKTPLSIIWIGTIIFMLPCLRNGFPFTYLDTHAYIYSGMAISVPFDRPIFYGIWLLLTSIGLSLWLPIVLQCLITAFLVYRLYVLANGVRPIYYFSLCALLTLFSAAGINAGMLMPDSFTPILVCSLVLYLYDSRYQRWYVSFIFMASLMHNSHWVLMLSLFLCWAFVQRKNWKSIRNQFITLSTILVVSFLVMSITYYSKFKQFTPTGGSTFFMMGRLAETGILKQYVAENGQKVPPEMCMRQLELTIGASEFIWSPTSPLQANGGFHANEHIYKQLIIDVFTTPKFLIQFVYRSLIDGVHQLGFNRIILANLDLQHNTFSQIERFFPADADVARQSLQAYHSIDYSYINLIYQLLLLCSFVIITGYWYSNKQLKPEWLFLLAGVLLNGWITATFGNVDSRLQYRMAWIVLMVAFLIILPRFNRISKSEN